MFCPGSVGLSEQFPDISDGESAAEGDAAHWVGFQMLTTGIPAIGTITPNGWAVDDGMIEGGRLYYNHVFATVNKLQGMSACKFEKRLSMPSLHEAMYGTPDGIYFDGTVLHVFDYKYGHLEVSPQGNWQLACYAAGEMDRLRAANYLGFDGVWLEQNLPVVFHIVQPRCFTSGGAIRTWATTTGELRGLWNQLKAAAHEDKAVVVGDHCKYCPARRGCATFKRASDAAKEYAGTATPLGLKGHDLATELHWCQRQLATLQARTAALQEQAAYDLALDRSSVPGFGMERAAGSEKFKVPPANVAGWGDMMGVELRKPLAVLTPAQCRAALKKKGVDETLIGPYIERTPGKYALVASDNSLIAKAFSA